MDALNKYPVRYGDRIFVSVMMLGKSVCDLCLDNVSSMTDVIGEIRHAMGDKRGLVMAIIRNYHRGWSVDHRMMMYGKTDVPPQPRHRRRASGIIRVAPAVRM